MALFKRRHFRAVLLEWSAYGLAFGAIALVGACKSSTPTPAGEPISEPLLEVPADNPAEVVTQGEPEPEAPPIVPEPETPAPPAETPIEPEFSETIRADYAPVDLSRFEPPATLGDSPIAMATDAFAAEVLEEGRYSEEIESDIGQARAVILFTQNNLADTSVKDMRYRAEYVKLTEQWQLVWVGSQSRCWEGRGHQDWSKEFCS